MQVLLQKIVVSPNKECLNSYTCDPAADKLTGCQKKKGERLNTLQTHVTEEITF
jgi:hypothetical protein